MTIKFEIVDEKEIPNIKPQNRYKELLKSVSNLEKGKGLKIEKKSLNVKNPRTSIYSLFRRRTTLHITIAQDDDFIYIKKID